MASIHENICVPEKKNRQIFEFSQVITDQVWHQQGHFKENLFPNVESLGRTEVLTLVSGEASILFP